MIPARLYLAAMPNDPLSYQYGFDRGLPVDRKYIEAFLTTHADSIQGRCLEIKVDDYVQRFGGQRVARCDILDVDASNPRATIVADLQEMGGVHDETFDCAVVTHTLQYLRDPKRGVEQLHRVLKVGGTLLITVPCLGKVEPSAIDYWRFMPDGAMALFDGDAWAADLTAYGNALIGVAIVTGMATRDMPSRAWTTNDPDWPCMVGIRAIKQEKTPPTQNGR
jgi:SAM-dependent methyltransferase